MKEIDVSNRRNFLKAGGAALAAASVPSVMAGTPEDNQKIIYAHGLVWNRDLPGLFGQLLLTFDVKVQLGKTGLGTFADDVYPDINSHFMINSTAKQGDVYTFGGEIIAARDPANVGMPVTIVAEVDGDKTTVTITLGGTHIFKGAGIIAILIGRS